MSDTLRLPSISREKSKSNGHYAASTSKNTLALPRFPATIRGEGREEAVEEAVETVESPLAEAIALTFADDQSPVTAAVSQDPYDLAKDLLRARATPSGEATLRYWRGRFHEWTGTHYRLIPEELFISDILAWLHSVSVPSDLKVARTLRACLTRLAAVPDDSLNVQWLSATPHAAASASQNAAASASQKALDALETLPVSNGALSIPASGLPILHPPTARLLCLSTPPVAYDPHAACPLWQRFLQDLYDSDAPSIDLIQEWFGLCLTSDARHQKILVLTGPPSSGKSTIIRVLEALLGAHKCIGITFPQLTHHFGLEALVDVSVVVCPEISTTRRMNVAAILDALKRISGGDRVPVHRKYLPDLQVRLSCRVMMVCNELPKFPDSASALSRRLMVLQHRRAFTGLAADPFLTDKLTLEAPGILNWAIEGLQRFHANRFQFTIPSRSAPATALMKQANSPILDFIEEKCIMGKPNDAILCAHLWNAWTRWCAANNTHPGSTQRFGIKLHACCPHVTRVRIQRAYWYQGIALLPLKGANP